MVDLRGALSAIRSRVSGLAPDPSYALDATGFSPAWSISPDDDEPLSPRDLLCEVVLGDAEILDGGRALVYDLGLVALVATYRGERQSSRSGSAMTARERAHAAAQHLLLAVEDCAPDCTIEPAGYSSPSASPDAAEFLAVAVSFRLIYAPR